MAGLAPEGSQFDDMQKQYDLKMQEILSEGETEEFFTAYDEVCESFDDMGLQKSLLRCIYAYGFEKPSAIQQRVIDVIQEAQSHDHYNLLDVIDALFGTKEYDDIIEKLLFGHDQARARRWACPRGGGRGRRVRRAREGWQQRHDGRVACLAGRRSRAR
ncbi:hypothetical protein ACP70R_029585 [Stipagrostis hirtigluma subsp. patula]